MKNNANLQITHCPTCGSNKIHRVTRNISGVFKSKPYTAQKVSFEECPNCGERLFDRNAMLKINEAQRHPHTAAPPRKLLPKNRVSA